MVTSLSKYMKAKRKEEDGSWRHTKIILRPDSTYPEYEPIILSVDQAEDLRVIAETSGCAELDIQAFYETLEWINLSNNLFIIISSIYIIWKRKFKKSI